LARREATRRAKLMKIQLGFQPCLIHPQKAAHQLVKTG
jgi:hypothetical protein